jgi:hypothetical protein
MALLYHELPNLSGSLAMFTAIRELALLPQSK